MLLSTALPIGWEIYLSRCSLLSGPSLLDHYISLLETSRVPSGDTPRNGLRVLSSWGSSSCMGKSRFLGP